MSICLDDAWKSRLVQLLLPDLHAEYMFVLLWRAASTWLPADISRSERGDKVRCASFALSLENNQEAFVSDVKGRLNSSVNPPVIRGVILDALKALDDFFLRIHPRSVVLSAASGASVYLPDWLLECRRNRLDSGYYWMDDTSYLVPRGPLCRKNRAEFDAAGESLADRFSALSVVPKRLKIGCTDIDVVMGAYAPGIDSGVSVIAESGKERLSVIPLGQEKEHIKFEVRHEYGSNFARYSAAEGYDVVSAIFRAMESARGIDITIASEFFVSEDDADRVADLIHELDSAPNIFVAGSGNTRDHHEGQPWNESRVINSLGMDLWRQRKIWPSGIASSSASVYEMNPEGDGPVKEDNASGSCIKIVDLDGVGRCLILICQDLQATPLAEDLIMNYQPDWVFSPILDTDVNVGRWGHQRTFGLSKHSQAKFAIVSSSSLQKFWPDAGSGVVGMLVGPMEPTDNIMEKRAYALLKCQDETGQVHIQWNSDDIRWCRSRLS